MACAEEFWLLFMPLSLAWQGEGTEDQVPCAERTNALNMKDSFSELPSWLALVIGRPQLLGMSSTQGASNTPAPSRPPHNA